MSKFARSLRVIRFRGVGYLGYLVAGVLWPRVVYRGIFHSDLFKGRSGQIAMAAGVLGALTGLSVLVRWSAGVALSAVGVVVLSGLVVVMLRRRTLAIMVHSRRAPSSLELESDPEWSRFLKDPSLSSRLLEAGHSDAGHDLLIGSFDNDGRLLSELVCLPGTTEVSGEAFVRRYRFDLDLVVAGDEILVRKDYRGNSSALRRELMCLTALEGRVSAPEVRGAVEDGTILLKTFVPGSTVRDLLVEKGAKILSVETEEDPVLGQLSARARIEEVWRRGRARFSEGLSDGFLQDLEEQVDLAHRCGVTGFSLTFGNVVVHHTTGKPWLIDFDAARVHRSTDTMRFRRERDRDREIFNGIWGSSLMTEDAARELLRRSGSGYAPVDLGGGLVSRGFWSPDSGSGRWEVANGPALEPVIGNTRILDLGSNNGVMSLMMIRNGATRVLALERDEALVTHAREMCRLYEWRDMRSYDIAFRVSDMRAVIDEDLGRFDVVTAFCSLYYLEREDMARVARAVRSLAPVFVVQAKTDTRPEAAHGKARKSSVNYLCRLLQECGFESTEVCGPAGYSRPLIIARSKEIGC